MKKCVSYMLADAALGILCLGIFVLGFIFLDLDIAQVAIICFCAFQPIWKIYQGIQLLVDMKEGPQEKRTRFRRVWWIEKTYYSIKVSFKHVFFDDKVLVKDYIVFDDACSEEIRGGDPVAVTYYKRSRLVLQMKKVDKTGPDVTK